MRSTILFHSEHPLELVHQTLGLLLARLPSLAVQRLSADGSRRWGDCGALYEQRGRH